MKTRLFAAAVLLVASIGLSITCAPTLPSGSLAPSFSLDTSDDVAMSRRDVHVHYDAAGDVLELVEVCFDVAGDAKDLQPLLDGARIYPASRPWIPFDIDRLVQSARERRESGQSPASVLPEEAAARMLELEPHVMVAETRWFVDESDQLGLFRRWRIERFADVVLLGDDLARAVERASLNDADQDPDTIARVTEWLDSGRPMVRLAGAELLIDIPLSLAAIARAASEAAEKPDSDYADLFRMADDVHFADGRAEFRLRAGSDGWLRLVGRDDGRAHDATTAEQRASIQQMVGLLTAKDAAQRIGLERLPDARR